MGKKKGKQTVVKQPFVSVCTPTFNRRPFIPYMIKCFENQKYPKELMEWIIIDDGTDPIGDLVKDIPQVKYYQFSEKMTLGRKRNLMHEYAKGDILVYMDDDDYYPPERVSHAVEKLTENKKALCAGASEIYIYFKHVAKMYQLGPYGPKHATAGTFAFKRELLKQTRYQDDASLAEEKAFLKNYTVPFVQLNPLKTILVFSHEHNTFDKRKLLINPNPEYTKESDKTVEMFIKEDDLRDFYMNRIDEVLKDYEFGRPEMKPDVLAQTKVLEKQRAEEEIRLRNEMANKPIVAVQPDGSQTVMNNFQITQYIKQMQNDIDDLTRKLQEKDKYIALLEKKVAVYRSQPQKK